MRTLRIRSVVAAAGVVLACTWAAACGGGAEHEASGDEDAGDGATASGGAAGAGGSSSGGSTQTGDASATGGASQSGGAGNSDSGSEGGLPDGGALCMAQPGPGRTAICVTLNPEDITAESDPAFDKSGVLVVQVFDNPHPADGDPPLDQIRLPRAGQTGEISLDDLRPLRLAGAFPTTVYLRALFVDNPNPTRKIEVGTWIGGLNTADGLQENEPLLPVTLQPGVANAVTLDLVAFRQLTVTVHASATPVGDGQGPLAVIVVNSNDPSSGDGGKPQPYGFAEAACADVTQGDVTVTGVLVGSGPYWITGILKDLGGTEDLPAGSLAALSVGSTVTIPTQLTMTATDYTPSATIDLGYVVPLPVDAGAVPPNSCSDLSPASDAGIGDAAGGG